MSNLDIRGGDVQSIDERLVLADGRTLSYRDEGDHDHPAVLFQPGFMACRLTGRAAAGVRVVTVERPGIGGSSPKPDRSILDWPDDVAALADHLGLERFGVLGHSAGSPYAAACAFRLPDRVRALGIACGFAPLDRPGALDGVSPRSARGFRGLQKAPWVAALATRSLPRQYKRDSAEAFEKQFGRDLPPCDRRALEDPSNLRALLDAAVESTAQGPKPLATEMKLVFARPWGFDLSAIRTPVKLWYGDDDTLTPPQMGRYLESEIPGARLTIYPGEGHMAAFNHWLEIARALTSGG